MSARNTLRGLAAMLLAATLLGQASATRVVADTVTTAPSGQLDASSVLIPADRPGR